MGVVHFITHPDVTIDPAIPVPDWALSPRGLARMRSCLGAPWLGGIGAVFCSQERKARDGAAILGAHLGLTPRVHPGLGENDRSATGYLAREEFERTADAFFAAPDQSVRGWERAVDAQARIVAAMADIREQAPPGRDIAVVAHGGVGALFLAHLLGREISRATDQPANGGGNRFAFEAGTGRLLHGWLAIDPVPRGIGE